MVSRFNRANRDGIASDAISCAMWICCNGPVDLDQCLLLEFARRCKRGANREPDMVNVRNRSGSVVGNAFALFGLRGRVWIVASPAILMVSHAGAQTPPTTPPRRPLRRRSLVRNESGTTPGAQNDVRNDARGAPDDAKSGARARRAT